MTLESADKPLLSLRFQSLLLPHKIQGIVSVPADWGNIYS